MSRRLSAADEDPKLLERTTEMNRHIALPVHNHDDNDADMERRRPVLDTPVVLRSKHKVIMSQHYGRLPHNNNNDKERQRLYLVAYDFSHESQGALEWTLGTMLRDGDRLLVMTVMQETNMAPVDLLKAAQELNKRTRKIVEKMLLFDIKVVTAVMQGPVKQVLQSVVLLLSEIKYVTGCGISFLMKHDFQDR